MVVDWENLIKGRLLEVGDRANSVNSGLLALSALWWRKYVGFADCRASDLSQMGLLALGDMTFSWGSGKGSAKILTDNCQPNLHKLIARVWANSF